MPADGLLNRVGIRMDSRRARAPDHCDRNIIGPEYASMLAVALPKAKFTGEAGLRHASRDLSLAITRRRFDNITMGVKRFDASMEDGMR